MYLSASAVAVSTKERYNKCSTFYLYMVAVEDELCRNAMSSTANAQYTADASATQLSSSVASASAACTGHDVM